VSVRSSIVPIAERELGVHEVPMGSNTGHRVREYQAATFLGGTGWPWCAAFVNWVWRRAGTKWPYHSASAWGMLSWAHAHGAQVWLPKAGDAVVFNWGDGHIAIFTRFIAGGVEVIGGNQDDQVSRKVYPKSTVKGYINATKFTAHPKPPKPRKPYWELVESAGGHTYIVWRGGRGKKLPRWVKLAAKFAKHLRVRRHK
jgi:uncharacterized protein (TIGR02594 family)